MAKKAKQKIKRSGWRLALPAILLAICLGFAGWMYGQARITHLKSAEVYMDDLPAAMDGSQVLFLSDLNLASAADARDVAKLLERLHDLQADMLILGGDYFLADEGMQPFFEALSAFPAPMGKFAVAGEQDGAQLEAPFAECGVQYLQDACAMVEKDGAQLVIAGLNDVSAGKTPYTQLGRHFDGDECVIAVAHNPSAYVGVRISEARGGGAWADLVLSGHTLGGQIKLFGRTLREYPEEEARCLSGWHNSDDLPLLVSQGLNPKRLPLRLGTQSEIWLLTLRRSMFLPDLTI